MTNSSVALRATEGAVAASAAAVPPCPRPCPAQEKEREKDASPLHPPIGKGKGKELPVPVPVPVPRACACVRGEPDGTGAGAVGFRQMKGTGTVRTAYRIDRDFIMDPSHDAVQIALIALAIPKTSVGTDGRTYNNPRLMRWMIPRIGGEDAFRELVYEQWRENTIDGRPRNSAAAFMAKLYAVRDATGGAA